MVQTPTRRFPHVVVLLPGITGSVLVNEAGQEVWSPSASVVWRTITNFGPSVTDLELTAAGDGDGVTASRLVPDVTIVPGLIKIEGYSRIAKYLVRQLGLVDGENFIPFPYDWRLDNRINAERLKALAMDKLTAWRQTSGNADAKLILIGHSMGGLIARYFVEVLGGWTDTHRLLTLATPHRGSLNAVGFLEQGMKKGIGPFGVDLSPMLRSLPSVYQLLPIYPCVQIDGGDMKRIAEAAKAGALPHIVEHRATAARAFHQAIHDAQAANAKLDAYRDNGPALVPFIGIEQPTMQSVQVANGVLKLLQSYNNDDTGGDGTVPRVSGRPIELSKDVRDVYAAETHGAIQNADGTLANLRGILTSETLDLRMFQRAEDAGVLTLKLDDVVMPGDALVVRARASEGNPKLQVTLTPLAGGEAVEDTLIREQNGDWQIGEFALDAGVWRVSVQAEGAMPVNDLVVVASA